MITIWFFGGPDALAATAQEPPSLRTRFILRGLTEDLARALEPGAWKKRTPAERVIALQEIVHRNLKILGIPALKLRLEAVSVFEANFYYPDWLIQLRPTLYQDKRLTLRQRNSLLSTLVHEMRHAEQYFRCARWLAGKGKTLPEISEVLNELSKDVIQEALRRPLRGSGPEMKEAMAWCNVLCIGHPGHAEHQQVMNAMRESSEAAEAAGARYKALDCPLTLAHTRLPRCRRAAERLTAINSAYLRAWRKYRRLLEEADAFAVGELAQAWLAHCGFSDHWPAEPVVGIRLNRRPITRRDGKQTLSATNRV